MNWGVRIIVILGAFMLFIIGSVVFMLSSDSDALEEKDYYEQALNYDERYDKNKNTLRDKAEPTIEVKETKLILDFPFEVHSGRIELKRPSSKVQDQEMPLSGQDTNYIIDVSKLTSGRWKCIIEWNSEGTDYRFEKDIFL